jgi:hypothetical protein
MIIILRVWFIIVLLAMLGVTVWASLDTAIWQIPAQVSQHPWFIATLFDAYFAFIAFYCWVAYKESSILSKVLWLAGLLLLGNFVIASYCLIQLFKVRSQASLRDVLIRH